MLRKTYFILSLILVVLVLALLISGAPLLTLSLSEKHNVPLGNFITWIGFIALQTSIYFGFKRLRAPKDKIDRIASAILKALLLLSILWLPICYLLAGNISFTFSERSDFQGGQTAMQIFWVFNYFLAGASLALLLIYGMISMALNKKSS